MVSIDFTIYFLQCAHSMSLMCTGASPLPLALPGVTNPETALSLPVGGMRGEMTLLLLHALVLCTCVHCSQSVVMLVTGHNETTKLEIDS